MNSVCHITCVHGDHDDRIFFKMARSSAHAGIRTFQVAPGTEDAEEDGVSLRAFRAPAFRALRATLGAWRAYRTALRTGAQVMHLHDPELLWVGFRLKRKGYKVVYDMHELVTSQILDKAWLGPMWLRRSISGAYARIERRAVRRFDAIVLAESGYADELLPLYPAWKNKFHVIRNLPVLSIIDRGRGEERPSDVFTVIYVGGLSRIRGLKELVDAMALVEDVRLHLLGWWESDAFRAVCMASPGWVRTEYLGSVRMDEVYAPMRAADLGILLMHPLKNHTTSRPIKIYEYMACEKPMVLSDFPEWQKAFGTYAYFTDPMDVQAIADSVKYARDNRQEGRQRGLQAREAVVDGLCWERESEHLIDLYRELSS